MATIAFPYCLLSYLELTTSCQNPKVYWMASLRPGAWAFFGFIATILFAMFVGESVGLLIGATVGARLSHMRNLPEKTFSFCILDLSSNYIGTN